jgi:peptidoglycan/xylan/chitin deacetylase (PgdA/CDA1 family)
MREVRRAGALTISLDFELHWGMRDHTAADAAASHALVASRAMVAQLAELFARREIRATWATVGLLVARTAAEAEALWPGVRPRYHDADLDPYGEPIGATEDDDPIHLAGSLVDLLAAAPGQEVASHTFSHYYCLEPGHEPATFRADLLAAQAAAERIGLRLRSLVLPRNQWDPDLAPVLKETGFECYRGPQPGWVNRSRRHAQAGPVVRAARLASTWSGPSLPTFSWEEVLEPSGLCNVPASAFLRPCAPATRALEPLQDRRIVKALRTAAQEGRIVHLWWHPQNFSSHPQENIDRLHRLLDEVDRLRASDGMRSLSMEDVNGAARADRPAA